MRELAAFSVVSLFVFACGGSEPPAASPEPEAGPPAVAPPPTPAPSAETIAEPAQEQPKPAEKPAAPEPQFTEGMSVADAIKAVPVGAERANIDQETLSTPIKEFSVYEPCKPGSASIKMKIAVWDGKAVGIDVTSTPKNDKLVACIKDQIKQLTWKAHVKSLNTVEYSF